MNDYFPSVVQRVQSFKKVLAGEQVDTVSAARPSPQDKLTTLSDKLEKDAVALDKVTKPEGVEKLKIEKVILAGMSANLCVESHLRELLERGFDVAVAADATAAAKVPGLDGMLAALINFTMLASDVWTTSTAIDKMTAAANCSTGKA